MLMITVKYNMDGVIKTAECKNDQQHVMMMKSIFPYFMIEFLCTYYYIPSFIVENTSYPMVVCLRFMSEPQCHIQYNPSFIKLSRFRLNFYCFTFNFSLHLQPS